jgi:hypothetical protein
MAILDHGIGRRMVVLAQETGRLALIGLAVAQKHFAGKLLDQALHLQPQQGH